MRHRKNAAVAVIGLFSLCLFAAASLPAQSRGLKAIRGADMKIHLDFLGAPEFAGRPAPSDAVEIASLYLAREAKRRGLKPILPDRSISQPVPIEVSTISPARSRLRILAASGEQVLYFPQSFGVGNMRSVSEGTFSGGSIFIGTTKDAGEKSLAAVDLAGKMAIALGVTVPDGPRPPAGSPAPFSLQRHLRDKGSAGLVTIIPAEREKNLKDGGLCFDIN